MYLDSQKFLNTREKTTARNAFQLTDALMLKMSVPAGSALVPYLAAGNARNNREAILKWVKQNVDLHQMITASLITEVAADLYNLLEETIHDGY